MKTPISSSISAINEGEREAAINIAEQYLKEFGNLAKETNTMIRPSMPADIGGTVASLGKVLSQVKGGYIFYRQSSLLFDSMA